jgi:hypothetical protein
MDIHQAKIYANQAEMLARMKAKMDAHQVRIDAKMDAWLENEDLAKRDDSLPRRDRGLSGQ